MLEYHNKWNKYKVGEIKWINNRRQHCCRDRFVDYIGQHKDIESVLEVGGGELIEAQSILAQRDNIVYTVSDISDTFLENYRRISNIHCAKGDMVDMPFSDKKFDLVFLSSVLEHSPDIKKTIKELCRVSKRFYFTMFMWNVDQGDLVSVYHHKKKYYSSCFNLNMLLSLIEEYGIIQDKTVCFFDETKYMDFDIYKDQMKPGRHRNKNYLSIVGYWK